MTLMLGILLVAVVAGALLYREERRMTHRQGASREEFVSALGPRGVGPEIAERVFEYYCGFGCLHPAAIQPFDRRKDLFRGDGDDIADDVRLILGRLGYPTPTDREMHEAWMKLGSVETLADIAALAHSLARPER